MDMDHINDQLIWITSRYNFWDDMIVTFRLMWIVLLLFEKNKYTHAGMHISIWITLGIIFPAWNFHTRGEKSGNGRIMMAPVLHKTRHSFLACYLFSEHVAASLLSIRRRCMRAWLERLRCSALPFQLV